MPQPKYWLHITGYRLFYNEQESFLLGAAMRGVTHVKLAKKGNNIIEMSDNEKFVHNAT